MLSMYNVVAQCLNWFVEHKVLLTNNVSNVAVKLSSNRFELLYSGNLITEDGKNEGRKCFI